MIIDSGASLTVNNSEGLTNSWYMELNGTMDLADDSQLIQTETSDLVTSANGKVLRKQSGSSNVYWYTYMSSPVGAQAATTLGDDNAATNNTKNTTFGLNQLKEGDGSSVQFTSAYDEPGKISTYWTYSFINGITYWDWASLAPATAIAPGVGYIHKGTGNAGSTQEYLFEGRPNNGTILIAADDVDGDSGNESQADVTLTSTLIGNPYPSAIDAHKFIDDNVGVIEGTLYLWHQWAGTSHILNEYEGGYATLNKLAKIRAYQFVGISGNTTGFQIGTLTPKQYIPVGQSFITEVIADGDIEFNNSQRIFKRESAGESQFFRSKEDNTKTAETETDSISMIRLDFRTSNDLSRELVLGFAETLTMGYDYGYDAKLFASKSDDMYTEFDEHKMVAQAYPAITDGMEIPLTITTTAEHTYSIRATELLHMADDQDIFLRDSYTNTDFDLSAGEVYEFTSEAGQYTDRFKIVFQTKQTLSEDDIILTDTLIYYSTTQDKLFVKGLTQTARSLTLIDMNGRIIQTYRDLTPDVLNGGISINEISSGIYMVSLQTEPNQIINKKLIID